jgi:hypothetical protein
MRGVKRTAIVLWASIVLGGCHSTYKQVDTGSTQSPDVRLVRAQSILVAVPQDGSFEGTLYPGSGLVVARATATQFLKHAAKVDIAAPEVQDRSALLEAAHKFGAGYLAVPTIAKWEPRSTRWSGLPSTASVSMAIVDVSTGQEIRSALLDGESHSGLGAGLGGSSSPERLLPHLIGDYLDGLY